jgi:hypothetical protein
MTLSTFCRSRRSPVRHRRAASLAVLVVVSSTWIIRENESGLVIKKYGPALAPGRLVALDGEAGYQARMLPPGWHFVPFAGSTTSSRCRRWWCRPARSRWSSPADGAADPDRAHARAEDRLRQFQDAEAFLRGGGERGRQLGVPDRGHLPHQPGAVPAGHRPQRGGPRHDAASCA